MTTDLLGRTAKLAAGVLYKRIGLRKNRIKRLSLGNTVFKLLSLLGIVFSLEVELLVFLLDTVDFLDNRP